MKKMMNSSGCCMCSSFSCCWSWCSSFSSLDDACSWWKWRCFWSCWRCSGFFGWWKLTRKLTLFLSSILSYTHTYITYTCTYNPLKFKLVWGCSCDVQFVVVGKRVFSLFLIFTSLRNQICLLNSIHELNFHI